jgi:hypothetical protein
MTLNIPNLDRLISHLERLPEEKFNMGFVQRKTECGTVACIAGYIQILNGDYTNPESFLDMDIRIAERLVMPPGWLDEEDLPTPRYPLSRAIRTLKHMRSEYLRTGQVVVDWDAPEPVPKATWSAPHALEQRKPALPAEIVRFLNPADHEVVS